MKYLLKGIFTIIAGTLFMVAFAQTKPAGSSLKFDIKGKTESFKASELIHYNQFVPGNENERSGNKHVLAVFYAPKSDYTLQIMIHTAPHTNPVAGKIPLVQTVFPTDGPCPAVYLYLTRQNGKEYDFYISSLPDSGSFEITKVAAGWVEGKFELDMPNEFEENGDTLHLTNGLFRFNIDKESRE